MNNLNETRARVASLLKHYREVAGLTIREAGEQIGKSNQTVSAWEQGRGQPDAEMFLKLCDVYGVESVSVFFGEPAFKSMELDSRELEIIKKYRLLDPRGQQAVADTLERELGYAEQATQVLLAARSGEIGNSVVHIDAANKALDMIDSATVEADSENDKL